MHHHFLARFTQNFLYEFIAFLYRWNLYFMLFTIRNLDFEVLEVWGKFIDGSREIDDVGDSYSEKYFFARSSHKISHENIGENFVHF